MRRTFFKARIHRATVTHAGERGSGIACINGAAAHLGDGENRMVDRHAVEVPGPQRRVSA